MVATSPEEQKQGLGAEKPFKVLKNLTGHALPGQTMYIMGASGAGKTSLMNALSDRINKSGKQKIEGQILFND
jgi:ABC-type multidrug transport system ATPase subunit